MGGIDLEELRLENYDLGLGKSTDLPKRRRHEISGHFLRGPIPLDWLSKAAALPGRCLQVGIAIWFLHGMSKGKTVRLPRKLLDSFGVTRTTGYRALNKLKEADLISLERKAGRYPIVSPLVNVKLD